MWLGPTAPIVSGGNIPAYSRVLPVKFAPIVKVLVSDTLLRPASRGLTVPGTMVSRSSSSRTTSGTMSCCAS